MSILQIVITKESAEEYKVAAMGLDDKGRGVTLGVERGPKGAINPIVAALVLMLEASK